MDNVVRCIVAGLNPNGESDLFFCKVHATPDEIECEDAPHLAAAKAGALLHGCEGPLVVFDERQPAGKAMLPLFDWETASTFTIPRHFPEHDAYFFLEDIHLASVQASASGKMTDNVGVVCFDSLGEEDAARAKAIQAQLAQR